jgi:anhydro-N-acetylmuramic acid kinase
MSKLFIGTMSGTSGDGVDVSLCRTDGQKQFSVLDNFSLSYSASLQSKLKSLYQTPNYEQIAALELDVTRKHHEAIDGLLNKSGYKAQDIYAIGFHGQTLYHNPSYFYSLQIGNPYLLAKYTNIGKVVFDFRRRDMCFNGQGAPLVPVFHKLLLQDFEVAAAIINIGGVANITYYDPESKALIAFDTGPGNAYIDDAMARYFGRNYDDLGKVAASGKVDYASVDRLMKAPYFSTPWPKSLDRNEFTLQVNEETKHLTSKPEDLIATLTYFTASSICLGLELFQPRAEKVFFCGGGRKNLTLIDFIIQIAQQRQISLEVRNIEQMTFSGDVVFDDGKLHGDFIEAQAFAYLAARFFVHQFSSFPATTGTDVPIIAGTLFENFI